MEPPDFIDVFGPDPTGGLRGLRNLDMALRIIREAIEDCARPGTIPSREYMMPEPWLEKDGFHSLADAAR